MKKLGKYEVLGELGHGAMGVVYRARDPIINRLVALKTITTGLADDPNLLQRFYREAQAAGGLQHPNIVTIYDMGDEQKLPYIAMELIEGESLEQIIHRRANISVALKLTYALQACRAFDYAHKRGIVHRDIKPGNVMVTRESVVKVVDFGIARVLDTSKTQTGMLIGTFAYMSPEQYNGEHADERSDIWSFGVLLYELLCFQRPFTGETPASLMHSICSQEPRPVCGRAPDCPPEIETIVGKLLRKSPQERLQSMEDVLLELEPVLKELQSRSVAELVTQSRGLIDRGEFAQAREVLRDSLRIDSTNTQARALLEKANAELKRLLIRPKAQQHVGKGRALLEEGRVQEAKAEAENALNLDSTFGPARELEQDIRRELERVQMVMDWLQAAGQRLAEGMPDEADQLLAKVFEVEPANKQAEALKGQVLAEKAEQQRRLRRSQEMQEARALWTRLDYEGCIAILGRLQKEFPGDEQVQGLLDTVREDQAEQHRLKTLERARGFLAAGKYAESRELLLGLQRQFASDEEIARLLEDVRADEAKQRRLQGLAEAGNFLSSREYEKCIARLTGLEKEFPGDWEILQALKVAREDQAEQQRQQGIAEVRNLLAARRYDDGTALLSTLRTRFPNDREIPELQNSLREEQLERRKQASLARVRNLLASGEYEQCIELLAELGKEFPGEEEIPRLLKTARAEQAEQQKQQGIAAVRKLLAAQRYEECGQLLAKLQQQFVNDADIAQLQKTLEQAQAEQRKAQGLTKARNLLAARSYEESIALLGDMGGEFSDDETVSRLLATAREGLGEQRKLKSLEEARALLAAQRYDECVTLLTRLKKEFAEDREITRLLANATKERGEQEKQQKLAEGRALLAAQRFDEALTVLDALRAAHPKDTAVEKLRTLVEQEREKQSRAERLQREIESLKKLVSEKKYTEILDRAEPLKSEFGTSGDLLRMIDFARAQQTQIESEKRLRAVIDEVKAHTLANRFAEAVRAANKGLKQFPGNAELDYLREQAETQEKKQRTRGIIEQRIREIKFKINREDLSEAIDLAQETIAIAGPDPDLTQLLNSARVEHEAREKKRRQEEKLQEIRAMMESGDAHGAAETLHDAIETRTLDPFDPRVSRVTQEVDAAKARPADVAATAMTSLPSSLSKEYALSQGAPLEVEPPPVEKAGVSDTSTMQASAAQPTVLPQPTSPVPPPEPVAQPVAPPAAAPVEAPRPLPVRLPMPEVERPPARVPQPAVREEPARPPRDIKKVVILASAVLVVVGSLWGMLYFVMSWKPWQNEGGQTPAQNTSATQSDTNATPAGTPPAPSPPAVDPAESRQRAAIAAADKLIALGDLNSALKALQDAEKAGGPLTADIKTKEATVSESMHDAALAKVRQQEATLWQEVSKELDRADFGSARRDLQKILALGQGGVRRSEAQRFLDEVLPKRQKEEDTYRQAQQSALASDEAGLQRADSQLRQVIAFAGPRKAQAEELRREVDAKIANLNQASRKNQIASLENEGRADIKQGDLNAARQVAEQIRVAGGDPTQLLMEIDQALQSQGQQERQFQQALHDYFGVGARDRNGLERSRDDFQAIANGNGSRAATARQYVAEIDRKLETLNQPAGAGTLGKAEPSSAADQGAIRDALEQFNAAFEHRKVVELKDIWPEATKFYLNYLRPQPGNAKVILRLKAVKEPLIMGTTAQVVCNLEASTTIPGQEPKNSSKVVSVSLYKNENRWLIKYPFGTP